MRGRASLAVLLLTACIGHVPLAHAGDKPNTRRSPEQKAPKEAPKRPVAPAPAPVPAPAPQSPNECAIAKASARYVGYGYTHVVALVNGCDRAVECTLWTDVDPEPKTTVSVAAGDTAEITTRRGSPSQDVKAGKECSFK